MSISLGTPRQTLLVWYDTHHEAHRLVTKTLAHSQRCLPDKRKSQGPGIIARETAGVHRAKIAVAGVALLLSRRARVCSAQGHSSSYLLEAP